MVRWLWMDLTNEQWEVLQEHLPEPPRRADGRGRPCVESRRCLNGILWVLRTGAPWKDLPGRYGAHQTVLRRFQEWRAAGVMRRLLQGLARDLHRRGDIDLSQGFVDGTFSPAKRGGSGVGKTKRGKGSKIMVLGDAAALPIAVGAGSASPAEVRLLKPLAQDCVLDDLPACVVADKAYDSDALREEMADQGVLLLSPHRSNRKAPVWNDGVACGATPRDGRSSDSSRGSTTSGASSCAGSSSWRTSSPSSSWPAASSSSDIFEMASRQSKHMCLPHAVDQGRGTKASIAVVSVQFPGISSRG